MNPFKKELHVAIHAQTWRFRVGKYIAFVIIFGTVYVKFGKDALLSALGIAFVFAIAMHLFYRWMTGGWENDWGGYTSLFKNTE